MLLSKLDENGALTNEVVVPSARAISRSSPTLIDLDDGVRALIWIESAEDNVMRFATLSADGNLAVEPKAIVEHAIADNAALSAARATSGEIGIVWVDSASNAMFASVSPEGERVREPVQFASKAGSRPLITPAADGGFALAYKSIGETLSSSAPADIFFRANRHHRQAAKQPSPAIAYHAGT